MTHPSLFSLSLALSLCCGLHLAGCAGGGSGSAASPATSAAPGPVPGASPSAPEFDGFASSGVAVSSSGVATLGSGALGSGVVGAGVATLGSSASAALSSTTFAGATIAKDFAFATFRQASLSVEARDHEGQPLARTRVEVRTPEGAVLLRALTDAEGRLVSPLTFAASLSFLRVEISAVGIAAWQDAPVAEQIAVRFGF